MIFHHQKVPPVELSGISEWNASSRGEWRARDILKHVDEVLKKARPGLFGLLPGPYVKHVSDLKKMKKRARICKAYFDKVRGDAPLRPESREYRMLKKVDEDYRLMQELRYQMGLLPRSKQDELADRVDVQLKDLEDHVRTGSESPEKELYEVLKGLDKLSRYEMERFQKLVGGDRRIGFNHVPLYEIHSLNERAPGPLSQHFVPAIGIEVSEKYDHYTRHAGKYLYRHNLKAVQLAGFRLAEVGKAVFGDGILEGEFTGKAPENGVLLDTVVRARKDFSTYQAGLVADVVNLGGVDLDHIEGALPVKIDDATMERVILESWKKARPACVSEMKDLEQKIEDCGEAYSAVDGLVKGSYQSCLERDTKDLKHMDKVLARGLIEQTREVESGNDLRAHLEARGVVVNQAKAEKALSREGENKPNEVPVQATKVSL